LKLNNTDLIAFSLYFKASKPKLKALGFQDHSLFKNTANFVAKSKRGDAQG